MSHILRTSTEHKTASLAILHIASLATHTTLNTYNLWKLTLRGHLNTDVQAGLELGTFRYENDALTARPQLHILIH